MSSPQKKKEEGRSPRQRNYTVILKEIIHRGKKLPCTRQIIHRGKKLPSTSQIIIALLQKKKKIIIAFNHKEQSPSCPPLVLFGFLHRMLALETQLTGITSTGLQQIIYLMQQ